MRIFTVLAAAALAFLAQPAAAQLEPWTDYDISSEVWEITTVKVDPNMSGDYLEGIRDTWVAANEVAKKLGHIEEYSIYGSDLPQSGDFNMMLVVRFKDAEAAAPSKARYEAFMKEWGKARQDQSRQIVKDYPSMREITGQYMMRRITLK